MQQPVNKQWGRHGQTVQMQWQRCIPCSQSLFLCRGLRLWPPLAPCKPTGSITKCHAQGEKRTCLTMSDRLWANWCFVASAAKWPSSGYPQQKLRMRSCHILISEWRILLSKTGWARDPATKTPGNLPKLPSFRHKLPCDILSSYVVMTVILNFQQISLCLMGGFSADFHLISPNPMQGCTWNCANSLAVHHLPERWALRLTLLWWLLDHLFGKEMMVRF